MARVKIEFKGLHELEKGLIDNLDLDAVKRVVKHHGSEMQSKAQDNADFKGHYRGETFVPPTGTLKRSIELDMEDGGMTAVVEPKVDYAAYVELGTRFMDAQPYLKPAWEKQKAEFERDMQKLVK